MLAVLDDAQMRTLIGYRPTSFGQRRVHLGALLTSEQNENCLRGVDVWGEQDESSGLLGADLRA